MSLSWRAELPVLVTDAGTMGAIGVIRSLGRAGYPVHACASSPYALGLRSRFCRSVVVCPAYTRPEFLDWLAEYVLRHNIRAIIPSEAFLLTIRPVFALYTDLIALPTDEELLYRCLSKFDVQRQLDNASGKFASHLPPSLLCDESAPVVSETMLAHLGLPLFLKVDGCHSLNGEPGCVVRAESLAEGVRELANLRSRYSKVLIQGFVPGCGVGAFFLIWDGVILAEFQHRRLHEVPHTGGASSLRESYIHPAIREDALAKLRQLNWRGVGMLEYRYDFATDRFFFVEFNGRFWGSLHLALFADVDFPTLLVDAFHGHPQVPPRPQLGVRCRKTFPEEVQYVWSRLNDPHLGVGARAWSVFEFALLSFDPRIYGDLLYPGDRRLWRIALCRALATWSGSLACRLGLCRKRQDV